MKCAADYGKGCYFWQRWQGSRGRLRHLRELGIRGWLQFVSLNNIFSAMSRLLKPNSYEWLYSGNEMFPALLAAIASAQKTIRFEIYIYAGDELGTQFRDALVSARQRGVNVRVLIDALGSLTLSASFWEPLLTAGGEVRWFNPVLLKRFGFRDHRKMLVCDEEIAFVGGFNIAVQ